MQRCCIGVLVVAVALFAGGVARALPTNPTITTCPDDPGNPGGPTHTDDEYHCYSGWTAMPGYTEWCSGRRTLAPPQTDATAEAAASGANSSWDPSSWPHAKVRGGEFAIQMNFWNSSKHNNCYSKPGDSRFPQSNAGAYCNQYEKNASPPGAADGMLCIEYSEGQGDIWMDVYPQDIDLGAMSSWDDASTALWPGTWDGWFALGFTRNPTGAPASYPSSYKGCHWGTNCTGSNQRMGSGLNVSPYRGEPLLNGAGPGVQSFVDVHGHGNGSVAPASALDYPGAPRDPTNPKMPIQLRDMFGLVLDWTVATEDWGGDPSDLAYDASFDIWFDRTPDARWDDGFTAHPADDTGGYRSQNDGLEVMIWADHGHYVNDDRTSYAAGDTIQPVGRLIQGDVTFPGWPGRYDVWAGRIWNHRQFYGNQDPASKTYWNVVSIVKKGEPNFPDQWVNHSVFGDGRVVFDWIKNNLNGTGPCDPVDGDDVRADGTCLSDDWFLTSVQNGFETWTSHGAWLYSYPPTVEVVRGFAGECKGNELVWTGGDGGWGKYDCGSNVCGWNAAAGWYDCMPPCPGGLDANGTCSGNTAQVCNGYGYGPDVLQQSTCSGPYVCSAAQAPAQCVVDPNLGWQGGCYPGNVLYWTNGDGSLGGFDCNTTGTVCGWSDAAQWYDCLQPCPASMPPGGTCSGNAVQYCANGGLQQYDCGGDTCSAASGQATCVSIPPPPCDNPRDMPGTNSGSFNTTDPVCYRVAATMQGWNCYNMAGRTVSVNGTPTACGSVPVTKWPDGYTYFSFSKGGSIYAGWNYW